MKITDVKDYEPIIRDAYASDKSLVEKWHIVSGQGLDACVDDTMEALENETFEDFIFYVVEDSSGFLGYFGVECGGAYLTTIFISPSKRSQKLEFWKAITPFLNNEFQAAIYSKNLPCIAFYEQVGKIQNNFKHNDKDLTLFKFERGV